MDMLFKRYANPFVLLDQAIGTGRLAEFIGECVRIHNEEQREKTNWEFFLHKVFDKSFEEFSAELEKQGAAPQPEEFDDRYVEATIQKSRNILKKIKIR